MVFHSFVFIFAFLPAVLLLVTAARQLLGTSGRVAALLASSIAFYALSSWRTLPVLAGSFILNFVVSSKVGSENANSARKRWLMLGIIADIVLLSAAKYSRFFVACAGELFGFSFRLPAFALPLGISFFTLQQIMYLVDRYEGLASKASASRHALLLSFFPYVSAGPIVRGGEFFPQLDEVSERGHDAGVARFMIGLGKKVVLADLCARLADPVFSGGPDRIRLIDGWIGAIAFTLQLYFDFSGYSDMAIAVAGFLGLTLPENFNSPLKSATVLEFWMRWHMTLSRFITTYLFTPIVRAIHRPSFRQIMAVLVLTMTIVGFWHGAGFTFIVFGLLHGLAMVVNHIWRRRKVKLPRVLAQACALLFIIVAFVPFRAPSIRVAISVLQGMCGAHGRGGFGGALSALSRPEQLICVLALLGAFGISLLAPNTGELLKSFKPSTRWVIACTALAVASLLMMNASQTKGFIYRDF